MTRTKTNPTPTPLVTPGPWESDDTQQYYQGHVIRKNGMLICRMLDLGYPSHGDRQANARLIAEAPAMYKALETVRSYTRTMIEARCFVEEPWMRDLNALLDRVELP